MTAQKRDKATIYKATSWILAFVKVLFRFEGILGFKCWTKAWKICCLIMLKLSSMRSVGKAVEFVEYLMSFHEYPRYQCPQFTDLPYFPESRLTQINAQQAHKRNQNCHQQFSKSYSSYSSLAFEDGNYKVKLARSFSSLRSELWQPQEDPSTHTASPNILTFIFAIISILYFYLCFQ